MEGANDKETQTRVERLNRSLYFESERRAAKIAHPLQEQKHQVQTEWSPTVTEDETKDKILKKAQKIAKPAKEKMSFFNKLLIFSIFFFIVSFFVAFFVFYGGVNMISTENVDLSISGPAMIGGGEELSFQVTVQNNNSTYLELADLIVEFPEGTLSATDKNTILDRVRTELGTIPAGSSITRMFKAVLFGSENDKREIEITVEYRASGSNAIFFKKQKYELVIDSSPVALSLNFPDAVMAGQKFDFSAEITSNSAHIIKDFIFKIDYPFGFVFQDSNLAPNHLDNLWDFGDIAPYSTKTLKIEGILEGQDGEQRVYKFSGGIRDIANPNEIKAKLISVTEPVLIKKTLLAADLVLNGDYGSEYIASSAENIRADILWSNNLTEKLTDCEISVKLNGAILNKATVFSDTGYYSSSQNTIVWDRKNNPSLVAVNPGEGDDLSFSFSLYPLSYLSNSVIRNAEIPLEVTIKGNKLSGNNVMEKVEMIIVKKIKLQSDLLLTARGLYSSGPFTNFGPLPPRVDEQTNYTVVWTITNTTNDISNATVRAKLPSFVKWTGNVYPPSTDISFNPIGGEIVWQAGNIKAGSGVTTVAKEINFQITLLPSLSQVSTEPILVNNISVEGLDDFTDTLVKYITNPLTTKISTDPFYKTGLEKVIE